MINRKYLEREKQVNMVSTVCIWQPHRLSNRNDVVHRQQDPQVNIRISASFDRDKTHIIFDEEDIMIKKSLEADER